MLRLVTPLIALGMGISALLLVACSEDGPTGVGPGATPLLLSVDPPGGARDVSVGHPVTIEFDHEMAAGMEAYADVHEGDLAGPPVDGAWHWSGSRTRMTFAPDASLKPGTVYVVHLGGGMTDVHGTPVDLAEHGGPLGGEWATGSMMDGWSGGPGMGGPGMGMGDGAPYEGHMGEGWRHANGSYGMVFAFRTAD